MNSVFRHLGRKRRSKVGVVGCGGGDSTGPVAGASQSAVGLVIPIRVLVWWSECTTRDHHLRAIYLSNDLTLYDRSEAYSGFIPDVETSPYHPRNDNTAEEGHHGEKGRPIVRFIRRADRLSNRSRLFSCSHVLHRGHPSRFLYPPFAEAPWVSSGRHLPRCNSRDGWLAGCLLWLTLAPRPPVPRGSTRGSRRRPPCVKARSPCNDPWKITNSINLLGAWLVYPPTAKGDPSRLIDLSR